MLTKEGTLALSFSLIFSLLFASSITQFIDKKDWFIISLFFGVLLCYVILFWDKIKYFSKNLSSFHPDIVTFFFVDGILFFIYLCYYTKISLSIYCFEEYRILSSYTFSVLPLQE